ncbi:uncharacterized protein LOC133174056 [Saccostrea echinata]|uniref:uncharacterized protein LOC133174056 n=1 Tax=Saccostrea echinata TaxID=191078 RepID=UPI002A803360|nr:uncharacterized protein LOC133174056 [Saccostrea echinata]
MRILDFFIGILVLVLILCSSASKNSSDSITSNSVVIDGDPINITTSMVVTHPSTPTYKPTPTTPETTSKEASKNITTIYKTITTTSSFTEKTTSNTTEPPNTTIHDCTTLTSTPMTAKTSTTTRPLITTTSNQKAQSSTTTTSATSNKTHQATTTMLDLTIQTSTTSTTATNNRTPTTTTRYHAAQKSTTTTPDYTTETSTTTTATNNRTQSKTTTDHKIQASTTSTFASSSATQPPITAQMSTAMTITTGTTIQPPTTTIVTHTTETWNASTAESNTTKQAITTNKFSYITQTSTPTTTSNTTQQTTTNTPDHTIQTSTTMTTATSNRTKSTTIHLSNHTEGISTPMTTPNNISTQLSTTTIVSHTLQTSTIKNTANQSTTTNISGHTTQTSTPIILTHNTTIQSVSLLPTTLEQELTSANVPKQSTKESYNTTTVTSAVESSSNEHTMDISENTMLIENNISQPSSTQIKTTESSSSTPSSITPLTTNSKTTILRLSNTLSLQFTMLITTDRNSSEELYRTSFYYKKCNSVELLVAIMVDIEGIGERRTVPGLSVVDEAKINITCTIDVGIPVLKLREQNKTITDFATDISNSIRQNILNFTSLTWHAVNISDEIEKQLKIQTRDITECSASGKLCPLGYACRALDHDHFTGICFHKCDLEENKCKNNGYCNFDSVKNKTVCRCQSSFLSLYYGSNCEDQTGKLETVIGFTLGLAILLIVLVFIAVLCCRRNHESIKEFRRHDDKSTLETDFLSESGGVQVMDFNYRKSTKFNPNSLDVDPVVKILVPNPADVNVSEMLESPGCSTISSDNSDNFRQENKRQESTESRASDVRKPGDEDSFFSRHCS